MDTSSQTPRGFHIMAKPIGPACNLDCEYCFYTEKDVLFPGGGCRMTDEVLEAFVRRYIAAQDVPEIAFAWQGGEPTLMGLQFFHMAVELQGRYAVGKKITNSLQTNGILLDDEWCRFLARHNFLVGLSLDGPREVHDFYRRDRAGRPTFDAVMRALKLLKKHGVEFNILACVTGESSKRPVEVYSFFHRHGVQFIQFIPVVERVPDESAARLGLRLSMPPAPTAESVKDGAASVTPWSVEPEAFGDFMIGVFDEWVRRDVGQVFVMNFEWTLAAWMGLPAAACSFSTRCGDCLVLEHNGDIYSCDHYVYPDYRVGNILNDELREVVWSDRQTEFGAHKESTLTGECRACPELFACRGECPKHRFGRSSSGEPGHSYLCTGYKKFFRHVRPCMRAMAQLLENGEPAERIMQVI